MVPPSARPALGPHAPPPSRARRRQQPKSAAAILAAATAAVALLATTTTAAAPATLLTPPSDLAPLPPAPSACTDAVRRAVTWGVATSAAQIEGGASSGGRTPSIWDKFAASIPSPIAGGATPTIAANHYQLHEQDFDLMQRLGIKAHRFSISWSRLIPGGKKGSPVSRDGAAFYQQLAMEMLARGITPVATLYHWDLPQSLQDSYGGWLDQRVVADFEFYAASAFDALKGLVKHWLTINEPGVICDQGYNQGVFAPGVKGGRKALYQCGHNLLLAHAAAVAQCRRVGCGQASLAMNVVWYEPADPNDPLHKRAAQNALDRESGWFLDPITKGDYPEVLKRAAADAALPAFSEEQKRQLKGSADFLAINTYTGYYAIESPGRPDGFRINETRSNALALSKEQRSKGRGKGGGGAAKTTATTTEPARDISLLGSVDSAVPGALGNALRYLGRTYGSSFPLWVTEFGTGVPGEHQRRGLAAVDDRERVSSLSSYLEGACAAAASGEARLRAVFAWTFLDNFEWLYGYELDFGLVDVDYSSSSSGGGGGGGGGAGSGGALKRCVKASGYWFSRWFFSSGAGL